MKNIRERWRIFVDRAGAILLLGIMAFAVLILISALYMIFTG